MISRIMLATLVVGSAVGVADAHNYPLMFGLNARSVVDPTNSTATGFGTMVYSHHTFKYNLDLSIRGIAIDDLLGVGPNGSPVGIHFGRKGENGELRLDPGFYGNFYEDGDRLRLTLDTIPLGGQQGNFNTNIFVNESMLLDGHLYIQIYTQQYPNGEIRGQLPLFPKYMRDRTGGNFAGLDSPPGQIPAPATGALFAGLGLLAARRRR